MCGEQPEGAERYHHFRGGEKHIGASRAILRGVCWVRGDSEFKYLNVSHHKRQSSSNLWNDI
jgi:hypothetical protein